MSQTTVTREPATVIPETAKRLSGTHDRTTVIREPALPSSRKPRSGYPGSTVTTPLDPGQYLRHFQDDRRRYSAEPGTRN